MAVKEGEINFRALPANWLSRGSLLQHEKNRRQILYRDFIDEASRCYINAFQPGEADISGLVGLYQPDASQRDLFRVRPKQPNAVQGSAI